MKKYFIIGLMLVGIALNNLWSQPIGYNTPIATNSTNVITTANAAWYRGGNNAGSTPGNANIFGTRWNSGIYTITDNQFRMKLNGTVSYPVNGYAGNRNGYLLIGQSIGGNYTSNTEGAASLLHLNGTYNLNSQPALGYRPWMETGVTFSDNNDLSYFGLRRVNDNLDLTETTICWTNDNDIPGDVGPDDMVFRFTSGSAGTVGNTINDNLITSEDLDGLHVARYTYNGLMGLGNTFGVNGLNNVTGRYVRPQSLMHMSYSDLRSIWSQYTNRNTTTSTGGSGGTGETANDGLRIGIIGSATTDINGYAAMYNQEDRPILFSTGATANGINVSSGNTGERMRIMHIGAPTTISSGSIGTYNPASLASNITRMSISHNPTTPVTRPMSLLHLGYNTTSILSTDGWRTWMDVGMYVSNSSDHVYLGLKNEGTNRQDAVVGWGDEQTGTNGPDNLRFIFSSSATGGVSPANTTNGLEVARMVPNLASTLSTPNHGMMGIGDFSPNGPNSAPADQVDAKLDIDGDLRIRTVTQDANLTRVLVIDPNDKNRVHYRDITQFGSNNILGNDCGNTPNPLTTHREIPLNDFNFVFSDPSGATANNRVGIGGPSGYCTPNAKLHVRNQNYGIVNSVANGMILENYQTSTSNVQGLGIVNTPSTAFQTYGISVISSGASDVNHGILSSANGSAAINYGVIGGATGALQSNQGVTASAQGINPLNIGLGALGTTPSSNNSGFTYGVMAQAGNGSQAIAGDFYSSNATNNYGIYSTAPNTSGSFAGYFNGNVFVTGTATTSDQMFKRDIEEISDALSIVKSLSPKSYYYKTEEYNGRINLSEGRQFGFIAQEVAPILPEVVGLGVHPAKMDSIGNIVQPSFEFRTVNYNAFIPINTQAIKELNIKVDKQTLSDQTTKINVQNLTGSLDKVLAMRGVSFNWNQNVLPEYELDNTEHVGFIAQEINAVDPRLTFISDENLMHVDYNKIVPIAVEAIQELNVKIAQRDSIINNLNDRLTHLENCLSGILPFLCQISHSTIQPTQQEFQQQLKNEINVQLSNRNSIVLNQNVPNPFAEQTQISFSIPETVKKAQIHFYDAQGKLINSVEITDRGLGQINVFASDLSTGIYTYTLVADGQIVATKKMMKQ
ncbi:MAG: hypothetical protein RL264_2229 [Bacteroidota bacterium]|jgi:hypothetical protein